MRDAKRARWKAGGPPGTRTRNLRIKSPLLCQIELATRRKISDPGRRHNLAGGGDEGLPPGRGTMPGNGL